MFGFIYILFFFFLVEAVNRARFLHQLSVALAFLEKHKIALMYCCGNAFCATIFKVVLVMPGNGMPRVDAVDDAEVAGILTCRRTGV